MVYSCKNGIYDVGCLTTASKFISSGDWHYANRPRRFLSSVSLLVGSPMQIPSPEGPTSQRVTLTAAETNAARPLIGSSGRGSSTTCHKTAHSMSGQLPRRKLDMTADLIQFARPSPRFAFHVINQIHYGGRVAPALSIVFVRLHAAELIVIASCCGFAALHD